MLYHKSIFFHTISFKYSLLVQDSNTYPLGEDGDEKVYK